MIHINFSCKLCDLKAVKMYTYFLPSSLWIQALSILKADESFKWKTIIQPFSIKGWKWIKYWSKEMGCCASQRSLLIWSVQMQRAGKTPEIWKYHSPKSYKQTEKLLVLLQVKWEFRPSRLVISVLFTGHVTPVQLVNKSSSERWFMRATQGLTCQKKKPKHFPTFMLTSLKLYNSVRNHVKNVSLQTLKAVWQFITR